jgi:hypothetical protein
MRIPLMFAILLVSFHSFESEPLESLQRYAYRRGELPSKRSFLGRYTAPEVVSNYYTDGLNQLSLVSVPHAIIQQRSQFRARSKKIVGIGGGQILK